MSAASDLIERAEKESGQRIDDNEFDNNAIAILFGALSREMGQSPKSYIEKDDMAAGVMLMNGEINKNDDMLTAMLIAGMSPDDIKQILG